MSEKDVINAGCSSSFLLAACQSTGCTHLLCVRGGLTSQLWSDGDIVVRQLLCYQQRPCDSDI